MQLCCFKTSVKMVELRKRDVFPEMFFVIKDCAQPQKLLSVSVTGF